LARSSFHKFLTAGRYDESGGWVENQGAVRDAGICCTAPAPWLRSVRTGLAGGRRTTLCGGLYWDGRRRSGYASIEIPSTPSEHPFRVESARVQGKDHCADLAFDRPHRCADSHPCLPIPGTHLSKVGRGRGRSKEPTIEDPSPGSRAFFSCSSRSAARVRSRAAPFTSARSSCFGSTEPSCSCRDAIGRKNASRADPGADLESCRARQRHRGESAR
jgi:hypothetical protein